VTGGEILRFDATGRLPPDAPLGVAKVDRARLRATLLHGLPEPLIDDAKGRDLDAYPVLVGPTTHGTEPMRRR
jgi:hypothetical protein